MMYQCGAATASRRTLAFTLIEMLVVIGIVGVLMGLALAGVQRVRTSSLRLSCQNNLRQLSIAVHQYQNLSNSLPPGVTHPAFRRPNPRYGPDVAPYALL